MWSCGSVARPDDGPEAVQVDQASIDVQYVSAGSAQERRLDTAGSGPIKNSAQAGDVRIDHIAYLSWRPFTPDPVNQRFDRDHPACLE